MPIADTGLIHREKTQQNQIASYQQLTWGWYTMRKLNKIKYFIPTADTGLIYTERTQ
jgi:hypothetical protein